MTSVCAITWAHSGSAPMLSSDSGVRGPAYSKIVEKLSRLTAASPHAELIPYGRSVAGKPLVMVRLGKSRERGRSPAILITGATHGSEYLNIETSLVQEFLKRSLTPGPIQKYIERGGQFVFAPFVNPDGYESHSRENAKGIDLNRDWATPPMANPGFTQPETHTLAVALEKLWHGPQQLRYELTVDYHCCGGALLTSVAVGGVPISVERQSEYLKISQMAQQLLGLVPGTTSSIYGYTPQGTSREYYAMRFGALAFTLEGRWENEQNQLQSHMTWWESVLSYLEPVEKPPTLANLRLSPPLLIHGE